MDHILCIIISCLISYIIMEIRTAHLWDAIKQSIETSAKFAIENKEHINKVVRDINKYYGGVKDER